MNTTVINIRPWANHQGLTPQASAGLDRMSDARRSLHEWVTRPGIFQSKGVQRGVHIAIHLIAFSITASEVTYSLYRIDNLKLVRIWIRVIIRPGL